MQTKICENIVDVTVVAVVISVGRFCQVGQEKAANFLHSEVKDPKTELEK